jgi:hypothetical protein
MIFKKRSIITSRDHDRITCVVLINLLLIRGPLGVLEGAISFLGTGVTVLVAKPEHTESNYPNLI